MAKQHYPLEQLLEIKEKRADDAFKVFLEKKKKLEEEEKKLKLAIKKKEEVQKHYEEKLDQFYESFQKGTTSEKIKRTKAYLKTVLENLKKEEEKVEEQKEKRNEAEKAKLAAKKLYDQKLLEVEKLELHKKEWQKEMKEEEKRIAQIEHDELSAMSFSYHKRQKKKK